MRVLVILIDGLFDFCAGSEGCSCIRLKEPSWVVNGGSSLIFEISFWGICIFFSWVWVCGCVVCGMGSPESDDDGNKGSNNIDPAVGGLVWVRRRNGSWWPGRILGLDEVSEDCLVSPKSGTPVKLLGRDDASV